MRHQLRADPGALDVVGNMKIVQQRTQHGVVIEDRVDEPDDRAALLGDNRFVSGPRVGQALGPDGSPIAEYVAVEEGVGVRAAVAVPPALGMKPCDRLDVVQRSLAGTPPRHLTSAARVRSRIGL